MSDLQPRLRFKHTKVVTPRTTTRPKFRMDTRSGKQIQVGTEAEVNLYSDMRWSYGGSGTQGRKRNDPIPRPIQYFRWWYRFLKMSLEIESLDYTFVERVKVPVKKKGGKVGYQYKEVKEKVKVDRSKYEGWDLDELMTTTFDKWWSTHKHLFIEEPTHVEEITSPDQIVIDENSRYFKIDTRMKVHDTIRSLRSMIGTHGKRVEKRTARWIVQGEMRQEKLFNCYNCLVMWLQGGDNESILKSGLFRMSRGQKVEWLEDTARGDIRKDREGGQNYVWRPSAQNLNKMRDMLIPARRLVLTVSDGYFCKHPRDKVYFKG